MSSFSGGNDWCVVHWEGSDCRVIRVGSYVRVSSVGGDGGVTESSRRVVGRVESALLPSQKVKSWGDSVVRADGRYDGGDNSGVNGGYRVRYGSGSCRADGYVSSGHSESVVSVGHIVRTLHEAMSIHVRVSTSCHSVSGSGLVLSRRTTRVSITVLSQFVLGVVLADYTNGCGNVGTSCHCGNGA